MARARRHQLQNGKYRGKDVRWTGSKKQVFLLVEKDFIYQAAAFHHVVPVTNVMTDANALEYMGEDWRSPDFRRNIRFFECRLCRQFAKHNFCKEVKHLLVLCCFFAFSLLDQCHCHPIIVCRDHVSRRVTASVT